MDELSNEWMDELTHEWMDECTCCRPWRGRVPPPLYSRASSPTHLNSNIRHPVPLNNPGMRIRHCFSINPDPAQLKKKSGSDLISKLRKKIYLYLGS